jgi:hypothetical protein
VSNYGPNLLDQKFGRLIVVGKLGKADRWAWMCRCECGATVKATGSNLTSGRIVSCGCRRLEILASQQTVHGMCGSPTWKVWKGIIKRCTQRNCTAYGDYGGRGIRVCEKWVTFQGFYEDMGERPSGFTIERKDVNGDYCKDNCEWVPPERQRFNTRRSHFVEVGNQRMSLKDACASLGVRYSRVLDRINKLGWSPERAMTEEKRINGYR